MRILDANDKEIQESDVNHDLGYLSQDKIFVKHHEAVPAAEQESHYKVLTFYFEDETSLTPEDENDPHIVVINAKEGLFDYKNLPKEEPKEPRGIDLEQVIDVEAVEAKEAYDEYEDIQRYTLYTSEELAKRKAEQEKIEKQRDFIEQGPEQLQVNTGSIDDLYVTIADITAGSGA